MTQHTTAIQKLSPLPPGWTWGTFEDLAVIVGGHSFKSSDFINPGPGTAPIIRIGDLEQGRVQTARNPHIELASAPSWTHLKAKDFLVGLSGSLQNYAWVQEGDLPALLNQRVGRLTATGGLESFIAYLYQSPEVQRAINSLARGAAQKNLSAKALHKWPLPIPSKEHQKKMALKLSHCDELVFATNQIIKEIEHCKTSLVHTHLSQQGSDNHQALGQLVKRGIQGILKRQRGDLPLIKMQNIDGFQLNLQTIHYTNAALCPVDHPSRLRKNDVLLNTRNTPELVGKSALWGEQLPEVTFDNNLIVLRPTGALLPQYLHLQLAYGPLRTRLNNLAAGSTSVAALYWKDLKKLPILLTSLKTQQHLIHEIHALNNWQQEEKSYLQELNATRKALLQQLLSY